MFFQKLHLQPAILPIPFIAFHQRRQVALLTLHLPLRVPLHDVLSTLHPFIGNSRSFSLHLTLLFLSWLSGFVSLVLLFLALVPFGWATANIFSPLALIFGLLLQSNMWSSFFVGCLFVWITHIPACFVLIFLFDGRPSPLRSIRSLASLTVVIIILHIAVFLGLAFRAHIVGSFGSILISAFCGVRVCWPGLLAAPFDFLLALLEGALKSPLDAIVAEFLMRGWVLLSRVSFSPGCCEGE